MQKNISPALRRLQAEDAPGQLRQAEGRMAELGSERGRPMLDWVEGVERLLADAGSLEAVEAEARAIRERGIRHIIWAGMGGSVITLRVLRELGFCGGLGEEGVAIYPLDSTDPAALNAIVSQICQARNLPPPGVQSSSADFLRILLADVMMVGVSMGMTSEEPITHLEWFIELLAQAGLDAAEHLLVMTLPTSYLDVFAHEQHVPSLPLQLDGRSGTGGRMSAPATRVFLLPVALYLARQAQDSPGQLRAILSRAWATYDLDQACDSPARHPFVRLAVALSDASLDGVCRMLLRLPASWQPLVLWIEQLMEESLGKEGKGIIVFTEQPLNARAPFYRTQATLHVRVATDGDEPGGGEAFALVQPYLSAREPAERLAALAASFLGWQLSMALYGYLHEIHFAGQPAVENYKARARVLRTRTDPLEELTSEGGVREGGLWLLGAGKQGLPAQAFAASLSQALCQPGQAEGARLDYLDLTVNGEATASWEPPLQLYVRALANALLGVPAKLRSAPAAYHSTEQGEMDGSAYLISLRLLAREHAACMIGTYTDTFLRAQAVSTWQAMCEQGRRCCLLVVAGTGDEAGEALEHFFQALPGYLTAAGLPRPKNEER